MPSLKTKVSLRRAEKLAEAVCDQLEPACERLAVAGSIRRRAEEVGDIELLAIPRMERAGLFGDREVSALQQACERLAAEGRWSRVKGGERYQQYLIDRPAPGNQDVCVAVDLYLARPEQWGVLLAVRTGPEAFTRSLVTQRSKGGRLSDEWRIHDWLVWKREDVMSGMIDGRDYRGPFVTVMPGAEPLDMPDERSFLEKCCGGWVEPEDRR